MSKINENILIPRLKFPEFEIEGGWVIKKLGEICEVITKGTTPKSFSEFGIRFIKIEAFEENKIISQKCVFIDDDTHQKELKRSILKKHDILFAIAGTIGKVNIITEDLLPANTNQALAIIRLNKNENTHFILNMLKSEIMHSYINKCISVGAQPNLNLEQIGSFIFPYPLNHKEQQKIASCLSSLDTVITTESQKLEVLKNHKKGLLQNLFPQEGETVPKLRFKEFEKSGEWVENFLGEISDILMCKRIFAEETNENKGVPFFKIGTLGGIPDAYISRELFEEYKSKYNYPRKGEVLITCSGTVGKCLIFDGQDAYFQDSNIVWIDNSKMQVHNELLYYLLSNVNWNILNSTTITRIYGSDLRKLKIQYPKDTREQNMVASCLDSCDKIIKIQINKIEELKRHKKGMLQGLFPSCQEIN